ncbi:Amylo-alpha-1,6-glucosidase [Thermococcus sp. 4557]|uniref:glycogen debranching N-terminal domain-containing protein n=1 Tax=Thermococcus sp. (strain CGMCC 1.5172 / 4557) TaxID=1042877 RepID=UPI000219E8A0|nr:glycogen debranching N-terminal domain-containing protein [Thermococcus sp. 4557]AEK73799.1 Amylo-alpha-1,6-glucosidase [Thermococcus sp. 4557]
MKTILAGNGAFVLSDERGNMPSHYDGFYFLDTRFVRKAQLEVSPEPGFIGASSTFTRAVSHFSLGEWGILVRLRTLDGIYEEKLSFYNTSEEPLGVKVRYSYEAPIEDIFQVRGFMGLKSGKAIAPVGGRYIKESPSGRRSLFIETNMGREGNLLRAELEIPPLGKAVLYVRFIPKIEGRISEILAEKKRTIKNVAFTGSLFIDGVFERAVENINALTLFTRFGPVPLAGIPYFACPFGRDAIITSLFLLPYYPEYAAGTLRLFGRLQGKRTNPKNEEEPGKIPHEFRLGELAQSGKVPFAPYYGTVDATPLYVALAGEYLRWTGDRKLIEELRPNLTDAVEWILGKLDDGYITYVPGILGNKGWKDSRDAIIDEEGKLPKPPIALVEVQGYAYWALKLAGELDLTDLDEKTLLAEAEKLKKRFNRDFWLGSYYALALDGEGRPLRVVSSNMGHLLLTGIAEHEEELAGRLFRPDMLSRYGIRTLSAKEKAYNPFSYHRGSVWPHDNALIALGLARIGRTDMAKALMDAVFDAAKLLPERELPELYSGLNELVPVPRANSPQAWSAASVFAFVTAALGMEAGDELTVRPAEGTSIVLRGVSFGGRRYLVVADGGVSVESL